MRVGDALETKDYKVVYVDSIERREGDFKVYNFEVKNAYTYFVSALGILVHNQCSLDDLSRAASVPDRGGYTVAGRSLTKHGTGARPGNVAFPQAKGSPSQINQIAQDIVDDILTHPQTTVTKSYRGRFGNTIEYMDPNGRGIVYDANGKFLFFKE